MFDENDGLSLVEWERRISRRGFIGWMRRVGIGTVGAVAGLTLTEHPVAAASCACCALNYCPSNCPSTNGSYHCMDSDHQMLVWTCCAGSPPFQRNYACGECVTKDINTCFAGSQCSAYWVVNPNGC
jgi:hypothetical protein